MCVKALPIASTFAPLLAFFQDLAKTLRVLMIGTGLSLASCIDCGICLQVCPIEGAIIPEERPELQRKPVSISL
jgi:ferredoxin